MCQTTVLPNAAANRSPGRWRGGAIECSTPGAAHGPSVAWGWDLAAIPGLHHYHALGLRHRTVRPGSRSSRSSRRTDARPQPCNPKLASYFTLPLVPFAAPRCTAMRLALSASEDCCHDWTPLTHD